MPSRTFGKGLAVEIAELLALSEVAEVLDRLLDGGYRTAVCSNLAYEYSEPLRRLAPIFVAYVFSYELGVVKPDPKIYSDTFDALGLEAREVLFVGGSFRCDFTAPSAFAMHAKWPDHCGGMTLREALVDVRLR